MLQERPPGYMDFGPASAEGGAERTSKTSAGSHQKLLKQGEKGTPHREGVVTRQRDKLLINNGGTVLGSLPTASMVAA